MAELREYEGDIHWYDLPDDEAEEDWMLDEESGQRWVRGELGVAR
ncbi:hypothetical protein [Nonomuraea gerenzanensis]|uniref:Uncharacterized protein n=1 Tax=Nonomuraea gerenzanensis TaxID=93944 RepID=A0A1M4E4V1_9ACTN|nr:hypothetical protein [Nonomuraea gerenzanensis]SBO93802.1 hypothetical protein BN4615_P3316 [Nonomuraea gerenzanensis]